MPCFRCCPVSFSALFALFPCCPFYVVFRFALFSWLSRCLPGLFSWLLCCAAALFPLLPRCSVFLGGLLPCCPCCLVSLFALVALLPCLPRGRTPIQYLYGYVPPNGVVILKLLKNGVSISGAFSRMGYNISNA